MARRRALTSVTVLQWGRGFEAAETRKSQRRLRLDGQASMGPRFLGRGNNDSRDSAMQFQVTLQWGRGFEAAETTGRTVTVTAVGRASMGPRF